MSQFETLMARDGHAFNAYIAKPPGHARGGVVIVQEIFGLTAHIRGICDSYAADGYLTVAPALFDRVRRDIVLTPADMEQAQGYRKQIKTADAVKDVSAAAAMARHAGKVAVIGYCWGGLISWLAARQSPFAASVSYYGVTIEQHLEQQPNCPTMLHFGEHDAGTPPAVIAQIRAASPQTIVHLYNAGHAFNNDTRADTYNAEAAALARTRTNEFLAQHVG